MQIPSKNFIISEEMLHAIGNYLSSRPYREVAGLIAALNQVKPIEEPQQDQSDSKT